MATLRITYNDKSHVQPYGTHEIQVWDTDMNELKETINVNADQTDENTIAIVSLSSGYQGELLIADTPTADGYYMAGESGTYTNAGSVVVDLTVGITYINVSGTQTVFSTTVIPVVVPLDGEIEEGETEAVEGGKIYTEFADVKEKTIKIIENIPDNSDFSDGLIDWTSLNGILTVVAEQGVISPPTSAFPTFVNTTNKEVQNSRKILVRANYFISEGVINNITARITGHFGGSVFSSETNIIVGTWETVYLIVDTSGLVGNYKLEIYPYFASGFATSTVKLDNVVMADLTETYGLGNEPTLEQIKNNETLIPEEWFDGSINLTNPDAIELIHNEVAQARKSNFLSVQYSNIKERFENIETNTERINTVSIIDNGDFSDGSTDWVLTGVTFASAVGGGAEFTPTNNNRTIRAEANVSIESHVYFVGYESKYDPSFDYEFYTRSVKIEAQYSPSIHQGTTQFNTIVNDGEFNTYYANVTIPDGAPTSPMRIYIQEGSVGFAGFTLFMNNIKVIDLTEIFGAGNEPEAQEFSEFLTSLYPNDPIKEEKTLFETSHIVQQILEANTETRKLDNRLTPVLKFESKRLCTMGDSITAGDRWSVRCSEILRTTLTNIAVGGTSFALRGDGFDVNSFTTLAQSTDWNDYDYLVIAFGTNDYHIPAPIGTINSTNEYEVYGAMNVGIQAIYASNPALRFCFFIPIEYEGNPSGLEDVRDAIKAICDKYNVPFYDGKKLLGWNSYNFTTANNIFGDGLHPSALGDKVYGESAAGFINKIF